ncbi:MAG: hypothetical protein HZA79_00160 [Sphingobacteriales bacterium]|nr:hypothetical protein [Sphingobacteriales bacterium]
MKNLVPMGLLFALFAQNSVMAQDAKNNGLYDVKKLSFLNAGIGLGSYGLSGTGGLPIAVSFEHGLTKTTSAGIAAGYVQRKYLADWKYTYLLFGARGSYHFNEVLKITNPGLDVYGGAGLLYRRYSVKYSMDTGGVDGGDGGEIIGQKDTGSAIDFELHAGGRYFFKENFGVYAELGYGISPVQLGATIRF